MIYYSVRSREAEATAKGVMPEVVMPIVLSRRLSDCRGV